MQKLSTLWFVLVIISCNPNPKPNEVQKALNEKVTLNGFYEYQSSNGHKNQYLLIDTLKNKYYGIYYKTKPRRGKGQWYQAHSLGKFRVTKDSLRFNLGERKTTTTRPGFPGKLSGRLPDPKADNNTEILFFKGKFNGNNLELHCISSNGDCPDQLMIFKKIPLPE
jgi:hypothetical protein